MSSVDLIFGTLLAIFILLGIWRGFFREVFGFVGVIGGIFLGIIGFGPLGKVFNNIIPGIPSFLWPFISFILIFIGIYILSRIVANILSKISKVLYLGWLNRLLGGVIGGLKGALIISLILLLIGFFPFQGTLQKTRDNSLLYEPLQKLIPSIYNFMSGLNFSSRDLEKKITKTIGEIEGKMNEKLIKYFFYGKNSSNNK
jgi:membrane protein required for colicin V production